MDKNSLNSEELEFYENLYYQFYASRDPDPDFSSCPCCGSPTSNNGIYSYTHCLNCSWTIAHLNSF